MAVLLIMQQQPKVLLQSEIWYGLITEPWFLLSEPALYGDLLTYLKTAQTGGFRLSESEMMHFVTGILSGLQHLHNQSVGSNTSYVMYNQSLYLYIVMVMKYLSIIHLYSIEDFSITTSYLYHLYYIVSTAFYGNDMS